MTSDLSEWVVLQAYHIKGGRPVVDYLMSDQGEWWTDTVERAHKFDSQAGALVAARGLPRTTRRVITAVTAVELLPRAVEELLRQSG